MNQLQDFIDGWSFTRSETLEILSSLNDAQLQFKPDADKWQPLYYQFGCIMRTQLVYTEAIRQQKMDFAFFGATTLPKKITNQSKDEIMQALTSANEAWLSAIAATPADTAIAWPDHSRSIARHIASLAEHERMHHGQLISYFTMADFDLPAGFKSNWAL